MRSKKVGREREREQVVMATHLLSPEQLLLFSSQVAMNQKGALREESKKNRNERLELLLLYFFYFSISKGFFFFFLENFLLDVSLVVRQN